jgi:hypothetical protein
MRPSVKRSLTGVLIAGALAFSVVGVEANGGGNGPDAFIGIINGGLQSYNYSSQPYNYSTQPYNYSYSSQPNNYNPQGGAFQANTGHRFGHVRRHGQGGHGGRGYEGGYYGGY